ncbi:MAG TPA: B12-binding domain-containing radical SAM protein [Sedimentisphaerales bacterium]|nr:B12-binding domain-containing radical SAM protein [Sedimentisphaerales bacterium]
MKILLVYPECPDTFWSMKHALRFISKKATLPPLGLLTVAAMLPGDWEKKLVDMGVEPLWDKDIEWADYVFISAMRIHKESVKRIIDRCKSLNTKIVGGGPLFTAGYEYCHDIDHLVLNEAEITLPAFLRDLRQGHPEYIYTSNEWADVKSTPVPAWELVDITKYACMPIQHSRGCPFACDFCDVTTLFGNKMRTKTAEHILAELDALYSRGWRDPIFFVDDNFIGNKQTLKKEVLPAIIRWMDEHDRPFTLNTQASINLCDDEELMKQMAQAGFDMVFVGIETPNEEGLAECNKVQNRNRDLVASVKKIQSFGLQVQGGFILGFDSDNPSIFTTLTRFIQESGIVTAMVGLLNAPPGTKLYKRLLKENRVVKTATGDNTDLSMNFIPKMKYEELVEGYKAVVSRIYSHKLYYQRVVNLLKTYKPFQNSRLRLHSYDLRAFLKSIWLLGVREKGRIYYWKLIFWSLLTRPRSFPLAVSLAIYGFHFRKIFETY